MRIHIKATGFDLTPSLEEHIESKVGELHKFVKNASKNQDSSKDSGVEAFVNVGKTKKGQKKGDDLYMAEIQIHIPGSDRIVVKVDEWDVHRAIDKARAEMKNRLARHKDKRRTRFLKKAAEIKRFRRIGVVAMGKIRRRKDI